MLRAALYVQGIRCFTIVNIISFVCALIEQAPVQEDNHRGK